MYASVHIWKKLPPAIDGGLHSSRARSVPYSCCIRGIQTLPSFLASFCFNICTLRILWNTLRRIISTLRIEPRLFVQRSWRWYRRSRRVPRRFCQANLCRNTRTLWTPFLLIVLFFLPKTMGTRRSHPLFCKVHFETGMSICPAVLHNGMNIVLSPPSHFFQ